MKIAVLGDIHGNIEALRVAYEEALKHSPERIYHLVTLEDMPPS